jgi:hypothetical protein
MGKTEDVWELYVGRQEDHLPTASSLNAFGVVAKLYD